MSTEMQTKVQASPVRSFTPAQTGLLQKKSALCNTPGLVEDSGQDKEKPTLQRSLVDQAGTTTVPPIVYEVLRSPGVPLDPETRAYMEPHFGHDFSQVRVHTNAEAVESTRAVNAQAYTVGRDVAFGEGQYAPQTFQGRQLLAHELTHVVQQREGIHRQAKSEKKEPWLFEEENLGPGFRRTGPLGKFPIGESLPYREATEYAKCIRIMGPESRDYCAEEVLGIKRPVPTHHKVTGITTPQPIDVSLGKAGSATQVVNGVKVIFLPDANSPNNALTRRGRTRYHIRFNIRFKGNKDSKKVTWFSGPDAFVQVRTIYGPKASSSSPSHYGRGTTVEDKAAGNTNLGFHESNHGFNIVRFIISNPLPKFGGKIGNFISIFKARQTAYSKAIKAYREELCKFDVKRTDCVGTTIDTFNKGQGKSTSCCSGKPLDCCK